MTQRGRENHIKLISLDRIICLLITLAVTEMVRSEFTSRRTMLVFSAIYPFYLILSATMGLYAHARQIVRYSSWNPTARS
jgi:hypothetical protein